ncbi:MAG: helix-turn-helix transcriptional regulator [Clostridia bacterium]|nr:helix-turn-helix transcriptional regulator [Clostridia bacterium]
MNYCKIGQKIRKYRKARGMSQEFLAEKIGISVTHMSHIETGNTKLSLPVFVDIARVLEVQTDDLLFDECAGRNVAEGELAEILNSCNTEQVRIILDIVKATKSSLDKHL